jgi:hypothetical protein
MTNTVDELRRDVGAAIELLELCGSPRSADWFREKDLVLAAPDIDGSHLATAKLLAASSGGMGRPLEVVDPLPGSGMSPEEADRRRDSLIASMSEIALRLGVRPFE